MRLKSFICVLLACLIFLQPAVSHAQYAAALEAPKPKIGLGGLLRKLVVPGVIVGGAVGGYATYRHVQNVKADIAGTAEWAIRDYGTPMGANALQDLRALIAAHAFVGRSDAVDAIANVSIANPSLAPQAVAVIQGLGDLGITPAIYEARRTSLAPKQRTATQTEAKAQAAEESDDRCQQTDDDEEVSARSKPGIAHGGENLPYVAPGVRWWFGTQGNLALIPRQVAERLRLRPFASFDTFREAIWRAIGNDPVLTQGFKKPSVDRMQKGLAAFAMSSQRMPGQDTYHIHHIQPIARGGEVYSFDNLVIVSPRCHKEILDPSYHYGGR